MEDWAERVRLRLVEADTAKNDIQKEFDRIQKEAPRLFEGFCSTAEKGVATLKAQRPELSGVGFVKTGNGFIVSAPSSTVTAVCREIEIQITTASENGSTGERNVGIRHSVVSQALVLALDGLEGPDAILFELLGGPLFGIQPPSE